MGKDARTNTATGAIAVGRRPAAMSFDADLQRLYVVNRKSDNLAAIDAGTRREEQRILVGKLPFALAVATQGQYAYIGVGNRLAIVDVTHPATPTLTGLTACRSLAPATYPKTRIRFSRVNRPGSALGSRNGWTSSVT